MPSLFIVRKPIANSRTGSSLSAAHPLQQLVALERAPDSIHTLCQSLGTATSRAAELQSKIEVRTENLIAAWNGAHPEQAIQRCAAAAPNSACRRFTMDGHRLCDACRSDRTGS